MKRLASFRAYKNHPWLGRVFSRLNQNELQMAEQFIIDNSGLTRGEFELKLNRIFMDDRNPPKHWKEILELLTCANSATTKEN